MILIIKICDRCVMDIQTIKSFIYVAKLGNYTKAAEEMNYAQSTITMQLQKLEKELGFPLFERIGRKNYLTVAGKEFLAYAEQILHLMERAEVIGQDIKSMRGIIKIGILESLLFSKFLPVLSRFEEKFSNVEVNIKIGQTAELKEMLKNNELDIIYISEGESVDSMQKCCFKNKEELVFAAASSHPIANEKNASAKKVFNCSFIVTEPTGYCYKQLNKISAENKCVLSHSMIIDSVAAIMTLIQKGEHIAFLPKYAMHDALESGKLKVIDSDIPRQFYYSKVLCAKNKWISPFIEEMIDEIKQSYV